MLPRKDAAPVTFPGPQTVPAKDASSGAVAANPPGWRQPPASTARAPLSSVTAAPSRESYIALLAAAGIAAHFALRYLAGTRAEVYNLPLYLTLIIGGLPLLVGLARRLL